MPESHAPTRSRQLPWLLVASAGLVLGLAMGTRNVQGLFMLPLLAQHHWGRGTFSLALGLQTLVWGALQPLTGWLADRFGTRHVIAAGCVIYAGGLLLEAVATSTPAMTFGVGVLIGVGLTATTFSVVYGALSRLASPQSRGTALGLASGIGGLFQFGWSNALQLIATVMLAAACTAWVLDDRVDHNAAAGLAVAAGPEAAAVVRAALSHSGFWLLNLGFVSCGFQLAFLGTHLPAYLQDAGFGASTGVNAIAIIALANAFGTFACGRLSDLYRRKYLLAGVYALRTLAMLLFMLLPLSHVTLYAFALMMGLTWLGTVPLTSGVLEQIFGVKYIGTLFGLVFLGHQLGGFFGAWLGGAVYDATRSYEWMWMISLALGLASIVLNLPIRDRSMEHRLHGLPA